MVPCYLYQRTKTGREMGERRRLKITDFGNRSINSSKVDVLIHLDRERVGSLHLGGISRRGFSCREVFSLHCSPFVVGG